MPKIHRPPRLTPSEEPFRDVADRLLAGGLTLHESIRLFRSAYAKVALKNAGGVQTKAAAAAGLHRNTFNGIELL